MKPDDWNIAFLHHPPVQDGDRFQVTGGEIRDARQFGEDMGVIRCERLQLRYVEYRVDAAVRWQVQAICQRADTFDHLEWLEELVSELVAQAVGDR